VSEGPPTTAPSGATAAVEHEHREWWVAPYESTIVVQAASLDSKQRERRVGIRRGSLAHASGFHGDGLEAHRTTSTVNVRILGESGYERRTTNDERRTTNDERRTTNDERRTTNDERRTTNDERRATSDERRATSTSTSS
jgi:hypothetical protein